MDRLALVPEADWSGFTRLFDGFIAETLPRHPGVVSAQIVRAADTEAILIICFADAETMNSFSSTIAAPWFAQNIRPFLAGPANRKTGVVVAGYPR